MLMKAVANGLANFEEGGVLDDRRRDVPDGAQDRNGILSGNLEFDAACARVWEATKPEVEGQSARPAPDSGRRRAPHHASRLDNPFFIQAPATSQD
jgi:hypothetical protein